jgi:hypothetical protein
MSLNETMGWKHAGSKTTCETDDEMRGKTYSKTSDELVRSKNEN